MSFQKKKIFIDGSQGTTGLRIRRLIQARSDIQLLEIPEAERKNLNCRLEYYQKSDVVILCLPDEASKKVAPYFDDFDCKVIDTSTAFRTDENWAYGIPELGKTFHDKIKSSKKVANPGCYPTGFLLLISPLVQTGILGAESPISCWGVSGYSGGGKSLIEDFESNPDFEKHFFFYSLGAVHKHIPEMKKHAFLYENPLFQPSVAPIFCGMMIQISLGWAQFHGHKTPESVCKFYQDYYQKQKLIRVHNVPPQKLWISQNQNSNFVDIYVYSQNQNIQLLAIYDNLGKGASGAAIQNLNLLCDCPDPYQSLF